MMGTIERFEDIDAWKDARVLVKRIYEATGGGRFERDFGLRDQIRRAAVSAMSNIAEGFERASDKEFVRFLYMAKGSAGEVRSQLYVAADLGYLDKQHTDELIGLVEAVSRQIAGFIKYLKSTV
jgi:four helix bundle protein